MTPYLERRQLPVASIPKLELPTSQEALLVTKEGIWINGEFLPYDPLRDFAKEALATKDWKTDFFFQKEVSLLPTLPSFEEKRKEVNQRDLLWMEKERIKEEVFVRDLALFRKESTTPPRYKSPRVSPVCTEHGFIKEISYGFHLSGERNGPTHIAWINGINNTFDESGRSAEYIQILARGHELSGVYNHTHTPIVDVAEAGVNYLGFSPFTADLLQKNWSLFHEANEKRPHAKLLQICHSQGAIHVRNALRNSPQEIRDRVIVVAIAPAAIIPKSLCFNSFNYASKRDFVYSFDPESRTPVVVKELTIEDVLLPTLDYSIPEDSLLGELILLDPHPDAGLFDHSFVSPTFEKELDELIEEYTQRAGEYLPKEKGKFL